MPAPTCWKGLILIDNNIQRLLFYAKKYIYTTFYNQITFKVCAVRSAAFAQKFNIKVKVFKNIAAAFF